MTFSTEIFTIITPVLVSILAYYYKKEANQNQETIKSLNTGMEELKTMIRVHTTNYEHLLREVQQLSMDSRDNRKDITDMERIFNKEIAGIKLDLEKIRKTG